MIRNHLGRRNLPKLNLRNQVGSSKNPARMNCISPRYGMINLGISAVLRLEESATANSIITNHQPANHQPANHQPAKAKPTNLCQQKKTNAVL
jgi:hypothetical protein